MRAKPTFGSAFAGIGGFELGLERAGWECLWQIENDKFCNKVLEERWPDVKRYGGIEDAEPGELGAVDLVCGGFPCQDLSIAGKRGGLSGERSGLFWELVRLVGGLRPRWLLIENVPGFLSSNQGEDFALAIQTLAELGYGLAWRVLDSQHFGVPQRRRRVFIVGHLGAPCPPEILFEPEGGEGDIAEGGKAGEGIAYSLAARPGSGGGARLDPSQETLIATPWESQGHRIHDSRGKAPAFRTGKGRSYGGSYIAAGDEAYNLIPYVEGVRPRVARPALGRLGEGDDGEEVDPNGVREAPGVPGRVDLPVLGFRNLEAQRDVVRTLTGHGDPSRKAGINDLPIVFDWRSGGDVRLGISGERASPLHSPQASAVMTEEMEEFTQRVKQTVKHCLQCPDSPRYRALGNAVTVQVAEWIGRRILRWHVANP